MTHVELNYENRSQTLWHTALALYDSDYQKAFKLLFITPIVYAIDIGMMDKEIHIMVDDIIKKAAIVDAEKAVKN